MVDIRLKIYGEPDRHGLKSIQTYFNLFPENWGTIIINGIDYGEADIHLVGHIINLGLRRKLYCRRCGHSWVMRGEQPPKFCPKCNSPYWNKPRRKTY